MPRLSEWRQAEASGDSRIKNLSSGGVWEWLLPDTPPNVTEEWPIKKAPDRNVMQKSQMRPRLGFRTVFRP